MNDDNQYVTLGAGGEVFAAPVETVREILDLRPITALPNAPPYLDGMIDLRGRTIPVVDLRAMGFSAEQQAIRHGLDSLPSGSWGALAWRLPAEGAKAIRHTVSKCKQLTWHIGRLSVTFSG